MRRVLQILRPGAGLLFALLTATFLVADGFGLRQVEEPNSGQGVRWALFAAVTFVVFVVLVYQRINSLNSELSALKENRADISIFFEKKPPMYSQVDHWYRILIKNHSRTASAEGVDVKLTNIDPLPPDISDVVFPTSLGAKDRETTRIHPNSEWLFDVVKDLGGSVWLMTKIMRPRGTQPGINTTIKVGQQYRMTLTVTSDNPRRTDRNGEERVFILYQPTGNIGDLEFYEEKANPGPTLELIPAVGSTPDTVGSQPQ